MKNENIKLEVGKSYLNRMGEVVKIVSKEEGPLDIFPCLSDKGGYYESNGQYSFYEHPKDLIEEVPEPKQTTVGTFTMADQFLSIKAQGWGDDVRLMLKKGAELREMYDLMYIDVEMNGFTMMIEEGTDLKWMAVEYENWQSNRAKKEETK